MTIERIQKKTHLSIFVHDPERGAGQDIHFNLFPTSAKDWQTVSKVLGIGLYPLMDILVIADKQGLKTLAKTNEYASVIFPNEELSALIHDLNYIQTHAPKLYMQEFAQELKAMAEEALAIGGFIDEDGV